MTCSWEEENVSTERRDSYSHNENIPSWWARIPRGISQAENALVIQTKTEVKQVVGKRINKK